MNILPLEVVFISLSIPAVVVAVVWLYSSDRPDTTIGYLKKYIAGIVALMFTNPLWFSDHNMVNVYALPSIAVLSLFAEPIIVSLIKRRVPIAERLVDKMSDTIEDALDGDTNNTKGENHELQTKKPSRNA